MSQLFLASASPRRKELLESAGFSFHVVPVKVSEIPAENLIVEEKIIDIARQKSVAAVNALKAQNLSDFIVICSDTEVVLDDELLGKPDTPESAFRTLKRLSGRQHFVKTAVVVYESNSSVTLADIETTTIEFKQLTDTAIRTYVQTGDPMDKAGSYGIQNIGEDFVASIDGALDNVIGLPVAMTKRLIEALEIYKKASATKVQVLAVSKKQPQSKISNLVMVGQTCFAENYVQEFLKKKQELSSLPIQWHFIGHLQKNKAKQIVGQCHTIHSVDSVPLAEKINIEAEKQGLIQNILIQINLSGESSKEGMSAEDFETHFEKLKTFRSISIQGLMTMPPLQNDPEQNRPLFRKLATLARKYHLNELSMGTSHDYAVAIEEGATFIRIGSLIFGERASI